MDNGNVVNGGFKKGFRQAKKPSKGDVAKENATLGQQLMGMTQFLHQQVMGLMQRMYQVNAEVSAHSELLGYTASADAIADGDKALITFLGRLVNEDGSLGAVFEGGYSAKTVIGIGSKKFVEGFEEQLVGMSANEMKTIEVTFPEAYPEPLRGKKASFKVGVLVVWKAASGLYSLEAEYEELTKAKTEAEAALAAAANLETELEAPAPESTEETSEEA